MGAWLLRYRPHHFEFHLTWNWLEHGLGPAWKPFLLGCLVCGVVARPRGRFALEFIWRMRVPLRRYHARHERRAAGATRAPDRRSRAALGGSQAVPH